MSSRIFSTCLLGGLLAMAPLAAQAPQRVQVSALIAGLEPLKSTDHVRFLPIATLAEQPTVTIGLELEPGDELFSIDEQVALELTCPRGTLLRFSGAFKVLINPPGERDCAVNFLHGNVDVLGDQPTEIEAAGVLLGPEGTEYGCEVGDGEDWKLWVYDGNVRVSALGGRWRRGSPTSEERLVEAGSGLEWASRDFVASKITDLRRARSAALFARFDIGKAVLRGEPVADKAAVVHKLERLHLDVLSAPADPVARADLARVQMQLRSAPQAIYNLERGGIHTDQQLREYKIDPTALRSLSTSKPDTSSYSTHGVSTMELHAEPKPTDVVKQLEARVIAGKATANDYEALSKVFADLEGSSSEKVRGYSRCAKYAKAKKLDGDALAGCQKLAQPR